jgi:hypothetical protein
VQSKTEQVSIPKPPQRLSKLMKGKAWAPRAECGKEVMLLSSEHTLDRVLCDFWDYNGNLVSHVSPSFDYSFDIQMSKTDTKSKLLPKLLVAQVSFA